MAKATAQAKESAQADSSPDDEIYQDFKHAVNMTAHEIEKWLTTDESKAVGWKGESGHDDGKESVGHHSGRRIIDLLHTKKAELSESDYAHMRKVVGYVHRHLAQRPEGQVADTHWTYSLKNWGHDPTKRD